MSAIDDLRAADGVAPAILEQRAAEHGDRVFIHYGEAGIDVTYADMADTAKGIAAKLTAAGIERGDRVCVFTRDPLVTVRWMFGIWRAGAVFCPVNYNYAGSLLAYQLNDTNPALIVVDPRLVPTFADINDDLSVAPLVTVHGADAPAGVTALEYDDLLRPGGTPGPMPLWHEPANMIYTSGTTGPSKGVVQCHRWVNQETWGGRQFLTEDDIIYNDLPLYHVAGAFFNVLRAAWCGARVAMWDRFSAGQFWERIRVSGATHAVLLDVMIPWLTSAPPSPDDRSNTLNKVHMQPLPIHHFEVAQRFGFDFVTVAYGQSESGGPMFAILEELNDGEGTPPSLYCGYSHAEMHDVAARVGMAIVSGESVTRKGYMGRPLPYMELAILDEHGEACDTDEVGELAFRPKVAGIIFDRYHGKPDATARALRHLWFHTGDAAAIAEDGSVYFVDRLGDRIRRRGENVSSFHVEDVINQHAAVRASAVIGVPSGEGDEDDIVAFCEPADGATVDLDDVAAWIETRLPRFMRPQHLCVVDALPRTPTNKLEKYKLRREWLATRSG